ncbi:2OG-Fe(II) oxygenase [Flavobacterium agricola]|uniref:2OG-Fe(II) oxygenase n=1 Tax=Flavobacterium agricola TaxID=2870839 RepID=A0ABY6M0I2_9FLAO|nr:2OG-Fe(II) oxygenase [Flavobacterium agricola]UYW01179.1 2OG-Fe(II) oxygenase [Flavobacterium agricola]
MAEDALIKYYESIINNLIENKFAIADGFFSGEEVNLLRNNLMQKYEADIFKKSAIGNKDDAIIVTGIRGDFILWLDEQHLDAVEQIYFNKVNNFIAYLNRTCFLGLVDGEFHYALYPNNTFYKRHLDVFQKDSRRMLSVIFYLNDDDWQTADGGELVIYLPKPETEEAVVVHPLGGRMVIFNSRELEHEVKFVHRPRKSITGWLRTR